MTCWLLWLCDQAAVWLSALGLLRNWQILYNYLTYSQSGGVGVWPHQGHGPSGMGCSVCLLGASGMPSLEVWWQATRWLSWYGVGLASADRLLVVVRIPAGPLGSLRCDPPKGNVWKYTLPCIWTACATFLDVTCMVATT